MKEPPPREVTGPGRGDRIPAVFLIGYRASGKSSVGRIVAGRLGVPFSDTDREVEAAIGMSISEYFRREGEAAFRDREQEALRRLADAAGAVGAGGGPVVATGGGAVLRPESVVAMRGRGRVVWLTAPPSEIRARLAADPRTRESRPALTGPSAGDEVEEVLRAREPLYRAAAHLTIATGGRSLEQVAGEVVDRLREWLRDSGPRADPGSW